MTLLCDAMTTAQALRACARLHSTSPMESLSVENRTISTCSHVPSNRQQPMPKLALRRDIWLHEILCRHGRCVGQSLRGRWLTTTCRPHAGSCLVSPCMVSVWPPPWRRSASGSSRWLPSPASAGDRLFSTSTYRSSSSKAKEKRHQTAAGAGSQGTEARHVVEQYHTSSCQSGADKQTGCKSASSPPRHFCPSRHMDPRTPGA